MISSLLNRFPVLGLEPRTRKARLNVILMFGLKGASILISLLYVPLLIKQLNTVNYGIWLTLTSIIAWISFFDIGLGHGLRNKLAEALAKGKHTLAKTYVSTTYAILLMAVCCVAFIFFIVSHWLNWASILNAPQSMEAELNRLVLFVFICFCAQLWLKTLNSILLAFQLPAWSALVDLSGQSIGFVGVYLLTIVAPDSSLYDYGVLISLAPVVNLLLISLVLFCTRCRNISPSLRSVDFRLARDLLSLGGKFFVIQLTAIMLFQTNNFVIAHVVNPAGVTDFNIAYKYLGMLAMGFGIISLPLWSATTDAFHRHDFVWIHKTIRRLDYLFILFSATGGLLMFCAPIIYKFWLGNSIIPNFRILALVFLYYVFSMRCSIFCKVLNGTGKIKLQFYFTLCEALLHVPLAIVLGQRWGIAGVLISMCLMAFINSIWEPLQVRRILSQTAKGVWNQ